MYRTRGNIGCPELQAGFSRVAASLGRAARGARAEPREAAIRILVVDDEINLLRALETGLEAEGFAVDTATTGTDALWLAS